jgi:hypothetical protein
VVAKIPSLFEDPTAEIEKLAHVIKQDICQLNLQMRNLHEVSQGHHFHGQQSVHAKYVITYLSGRIARIRKELGDTIDMWTKVHDMKGRRGEGERGRRGGEKRD